LDSLLVYRAAGWKRHRRHHRTANLMVAIPAVTISHKAR
jgi:hypothetical protein